MASSGMYDFAGERLIGVRNYVAAGTSRQLAKSGRLNYSYFGSVRWMVLKWLGMAFQVTTVAAPQPRRSHRNAPNDSPVGGHNT
jgi:hypothetical protein